MAAVRTVSSALIPAHHTGGAVQPRATVEVLQYQPKVTSEVLQYLPKVTVEVLQFLPKVKVEALLSAQSHQHVCSTNTGPLHDSTRQPTVTAGPQNTS